MNAPRYDEKWNPDPDAATVAANEAIFAAQREWCAKKNSGAHRKLSGTSTCLDCGLDLEA